MQTTSQLCGEAKMPQKQKNPSKNTSFQSATRLCIFFRVHFSVVKWPQIVKKKKIFFLRSPCVMSAKPAQR